MALLEVQCKNQSLEWVQDPAEMHAGNIKIDSVAFNFCELWDGFTKTAVFYRDKNKVINVLLDETNACEIPPELTEDKGLIYIGVFGIKGECRRTTAVKSFYLKEGILTDGKPSEPTPDIYQQIINLYAEAKETATRAETTAKDAEEKAQNAVDIANAAKAETQAYVDKKIGAWRLINDITLEEDAVVEFTTDADGNAFELKKMRVVVEAPKLETQVQAWLKVDSSLVAFSDNMATSASKPTVSFDGELKNAWCFTTCYSASGKYTAGTVKSFPSGTRLSNGENVLVNPVKKITLAFASNMTTPIVAGTRIQIWGVDA